MVIEEIISFIESVAPPSLQESYDNAGLLTGRRDWPCTGVLCSLDATESVIAEASLKGCNLVIAHHPIIFKGLKRITGSNYVERALIRAIKDDIAIYAVHTNLDNVLEGVNGRMADRLGLRNRRALKPYSGALRKLYFFVPTAAAERVRAAVFQAGAGRIGQYSECSFVSEGMGTFTAGEGTQPYVGKQGQRHEETELKIEMVFPFELEAEIVEALVREHPYEEVAYDIVKLENEWATRGAGLLGEFPDPLTEEAFLNHLKAAFSLPLIRHTALTGQPVRRVAICGGAGSFLISNALSHGAEAFITADLKYHEFFDANDRMLICDIGHFESEQFTVDLLQEILQQKFPTFAVLKSDQPTNPVYYYF